MCRLAILAVVVGACGGAVPERPNVLVITIDTLRADALGRDTPTLNGFCARATHFPSARTVAPLTLPAHMSLFTGLLPAHHGIHDNVTDPLPPREDRPFLLLSEEFRDAGYTTAAFVARAVLSGQTGIAAGFDIYECPAASEQSLDAGSEVVAGDRIKAPLEWMASRPAHEPWFAWVHFYDPHAPYLPYAGDSSHPSSRDGDSPKALYAGEVRCVDAALGRLLAAVDNETVVVIASDHGEGLGEHGEAEHGPLCYGTTVDIVLAVRASKLATDGSGLRSIMDVAPTLRRLCGLPSRDTDGRDLGGPPHTALVTESLFMWRLHGWGQCYSVTDGRYSLVESGSRVEMFDRHADRSETRPLPLSAPAYESLDRTLARFRSASLDSRDDDAFSSITAYGTLRRGAPRYLPRHENADLLDPQAHLKDWMAMETVPGTIRLALDRRDPLPLQRALALLANLEREVPTSPRVPLYRAGVCDALGKLTGEGRWRREAVWAQLAAIEKGYDRKTIATAARMAAEANDEDALRKLLDLLKSRSRKVDPAAAAALKEAAAALGLRDDEVSGVASR